MDTGTESDTTGKQDRLVLRSSKRKAVFLLFAGLVFVGLGFFMGTGTIGFPARIVGWTAVVFFSLAVVVALFNLVTNKSYLLLTRAGFQMSGFRKSRVVPWSEVAAFVTVTPPNPVLDLFPKSLRRLGAPKMVMFDYRPGVKALDSFPQWARRLRSVNQALTRHDAGLADTYGLEAEALAALMNTWRSRFGAS